MICNMYISLHFVHMLCYIHMIYSSYPIWNPTPYKILLPDGFCCCWISPAFGTYNLIRTLDYLSRSMIWENYNFAAISVLAQWKCLPCFRRATIFLVGWVITQVHILFCVILAYFERFKPQNNPSRFISEPIEKAEYHLDYHRPLSSKNVHSRTIGLAKSWRREYRPHGCLAGKALDQHMMGLPPEETLAYQYDGKTYMKGTVQLLYSNPKPQTLYLYLQVKHTQRLGCCFCFSRRYAGCLILWYFLHLEVSSLFVIFASVRMSAYVFAWVCALRVLYFWNIEYPLHSLHNIVHIWYASPVRS